MTRLASLLLACLLAPMSILGNSSALAGVQERAGPEILPGAGLSGTQAIAAPADAAGLDAAIAERLAEGRRTVAGRPVGVETLRRLYAQRGFAPVWVGSGSVHAAAQALLEALDGAEAEGLTAADYHPDHIAERLSALPRLTLAERAELDLLLTDAALRYGSHLRSGRVAPKAINPEFAITPPRVEPATLLSGLLGASDVRAYVQALAPSRSEYGALKTALRQYRDLAAAGGWPAVPSPRVAKLEPGMTDPAVKALRKRLAVTGEYKGDVKSKAGDLYDPPLKAAVERFQARHGLTVDGVVGPGTLTALNMPASERVEQILSNLERLRWLPDSFGDRYVLVNIPEFTLKAFDGGAVAREMRVIVGTPVRATPIMSSTITSVTLNPTWTMTPKLAREDYLPKFIRDPSYVTSHNFTVFASWAPDAPALDPRRINWKTLGNGINKLRIRQAPGPENALGQIKFNIPNAFDVYLHDTPGREKFDKTVRIFSSGCVRLGDPMALAEFVFSETPDWPLDRRNRQLDSGETKIVPLKKAVPVHLLYQTAWVDGHGAVQFRTDVYGRDAEVLDGIARRGFAPQRVQRVADAQR
ncbi:L,D-transpeptidase family protein [Azospirillum sp. SYSU D00513]|uniref:L,D-transpeptidase family protein n=1 Tax=Azospirillum sp. SYSU D00513 TaxID=2812561 RepID=UPI001A96EA46|nr:L,D-transpeptidase family protein [Azospirillum sp. SYSU D00513]